ncbi:MAG: DUF3883 domain-containing protein, partial [Spirochaetales bacterium]
EGKSLKDLLIQAIRYGEREDVKRRLEQVVAEAVDADRLKSLLDEEALADESMDTSRVFQIREDMERAQARRLQPHYIQSFFLEAFGKLGGNAKEREPRRYEITRVPASVRNRDRMIGVGEPVMPKYERVTFEKSLINYDGSPAAAFVCPGHPLLDASVDLVLERSRGLLRKGAILVDDEDSGCEPRVLYYLEHAVQDGSTTRSGERHVISRRLHYVDVDRNGTTRHSYYAPYLDYRPLDEADPTPEEILAHKQCAWLDTSLESAVMHHAIEHLVPEHTSEIKARALALIAKTQAAVKERLTKEINYWDHRAAELKAAEDAGKSRHKLNSLEARRRADDLQARLKKRLRQLAEERQITAQPPSVLGGALVVPAGLIAEMQGTRVGQATTVNRLAVAAKARAIVMEQERQLGFEPVDREDDKLGYDIESSVPGTGNLRLLEVKGRAADAESVTVTRNEILYSLNKPDDFILALVRFDSDDSYELRYLRRPFSREPDFGVTSVNYKLAELWERAEQPS